MRSLTLLLVALTTASCSGASRAAATPTPTPTQASQPTATPSVPPLAALVDYPGGTGTQNTGYELALVGTDGSVVARVHAAVRAPIAGAAAPAVDLPEISAANGRVYFLDGDQTVRSLTPSGDTATVTTVPGSSTAHAAFSVSPDGAQIAVAVLTYNGAAAALTGLYTDAIQGGTRHDIAHPAGVFEWPVAWHGDDLVLATLPSAFTQTSLTLNPYAALAYQVVDPGSGGVVATVGGPDAITGCLATGLLVPSGTACYHSVTSVTSEVWSLNWSATKQDSVSLQRPAVTAALSPDQPYFAICCDASRAVLVAQSTSAPIATGLRGGADSWPCWVDEQHVLAGSVSDHLFQPSVVALANGNVTPVTGAHGFCAAVLGGAGGAGEPF